jgi:hypothetical protein
MEKLLVVCVGMAENSRYEICKKDYEVINFLTAIKQIMLWIKEKG